MCLNCQDYSEPIPILQPNEFYRFAGKLTKLIRQRRLEFVKGNLGNPREEWHFRTAIDVVVHGSKGLEHIHVDDTSPLHPRYNRGRIFDDGKKSCVLIYRGNSADELESRDALKVFELVPPPKTHATSSHKLGVRSLAAVPTP